MSALAKRHASLKRKYQTVYAGSMKQKHSPARHNLAFELAKARAKDQLKRGVRKPFRG